MSKQKESKNTEIKAILESALTEQEVFVHINTLLEGVKLPESLTIESTVTLKLSYHYSGGLYLESEEVVAELLFPEGSYTCRIPYQSIWGMTSLSGESTMWPDRAPAELLKSIALNTAKSSAKKDSAKKTSTPSKPKLKKLSLSEDEQNLKKEKLGKNKKSSPAKLTRIK